MTTPKLPLRDDGSIDWGVRTGERGLDDLIERVIATFKDGMSDDELARAAIAVCEKEPVTYTIKVPEELKALQDKVAKLEAEAAALRNALYLLAPGPSDSPGVSDRAVGFRDGWNAARGLVVERAEAALLPDAGKALLAVVEAAREYVDSAWDSSKELNLSREKLRQALAALEKP